MGYATVAPKKGSGDEAPKVHTETTPDVVASMLAASKDVVIVPGYGMAVARAQHAISDIASTLRNNGVQAKFGIHPVAGRMPGQMNVLLAEAGTPYEWVLEMEEVNPDMAKTDVCLVVGANDITNSAAQEEEGCAIYGMPVIEVWKEKTCVLLGDAKKSCDSLVGKLKESFET